MDATHHSSHGQCRAMLINIEKEGNRYASILTGGALLALPLLLLPAAAYSQEGTAEIAGVVKDTSGAVLPGVTVEASSDALIEKVRAAVTDGSGQYRIISLRPGTLFGHVFADRLQHHQAGRTAGQQRPRRRRSAPT